MKALKKHKHAHDPRPFFFWLEVGSASVFMCRPAYKSAPSSEFMPTVKSPNTDGSGVEGIQAASPIVAEATSAQHGLLKAH